jgi:hypothetical protein
MQHFHSDEFANFIVQQRLRTEFPARYGQNILKYYFDNFALTLNGVDGDDDNVMYNGGSHCS